MGSTQNTTPVSAQKSGHSSLTLSVGRKAEGTGWEKGRKETPQDCQTLVCPALHTRSCWGHSPQTKCQGVLWSMGFFILCSPFRIRFLICAPTGDSRWKTKGNTNAYCLKKVQHSPRVLSPPKTRVKIKETMELDSLGLGVCFLVAAMPDLLGSGWRALKDEWGALIMNPYELRMKRTISTAARGCYFFNWEKELSKPEIILV